MSLGGGNDTYKAGGTAGADGIDTVRGGAGIDIYDIDAPSPHLVNLDSVAHNLTAISPNAVLVAANTATGTDISGKDTIFGLENVKGGANNEVIYGSAANNAITAVSGNDFLAGFGGNDTLDGGNGNDDLVGGAGKDQLIGGPGADSFHFTALSDSSITAPDLVADFEQGIDTIDLSLIDANKTNAAGTNDAFTFIGTNTPFTGAAGQLHAFWSALGQMIAGDVNGDTKADFSIELKDPAHAVTLAPTDFNLEAGAECIPAPRWQSVYVGIRHHRTLIP